MKAIVCEEFGPIDTLAYKDVDLPEPAKGQVRVKVKQRASTFQTACWCKVYIK